MVAANNTNHGSHDKFAASLNALFPPFCHVVGASILWMKQSKQNPDPKPSTGIMTRSHLQQRPGPAQPILHGAYRTGPDIPEA